MHQLKTSIFVFLLFIFAFNRSTNAAKNSTGCKSSHFEDCMSEMLLVGDEKFTYPTNMSQMNARCKNVKRLNQCTNDFIAKCLRGEARNTVKLILYGVTKSNRAYCSSTARKEAHIRFGRCANRNLKGLTRSAVDMNRRLHGVLQHPDRKLRVPMVCCSYNLFKPAALSSLKGCSEAEVAGFEHLVDSYAADGLALLCNGFTEESDTCESVLKVIPNFTGPLKRKSFFLTAVDVLTSL